MLNSPINVQNILEEARKQVWEILDPENSWKNDLDECTDIQKRLLHFSSEHSKEPQHLDKVIKAISRGVALLESAHGWKNPAIGQNPSRTKSDKMRGFQWRLVIAYSGFEIAFKGLVNCQTRKINPKISDDFIQSCSLPKYDLLDSPERKPGIEKWLNKEEGELANFLGVTSGDRKIIENWIVKSQSIKSWEQSVKLAKAIRNASAHGYLSATKVKELGLKPGLCKLTDDLAVIVAYGLQKLI